MDGGVLAGRSRVEKQFFIEGGFGRDFGGLTFQGTSLNCFFGLCPRKQDQWVDLVKRCDLAGKKVLIQLESLILAQSERWRQA